jgi:hypothetical protein
LLFHAYRLTSSNLLQNVSTEVNWRRGFEKVVKKGKWREKGFIV